MRSSMKPALRIFSHTCWFLFTEMHYLIMELSKLPRFRVIRALIASQSTFEKWNVDLQHFISYFLIGFFLYLLLHKLCSVLTCGILGIGLLLVQYLIKKMYQFWHAALSSHNCSHVIPSKVSIEILCKTRIRDKCQSWQYLRIYILWCP